MYLVPCTAAVLVCYCWLLIRVRVRCTRYTSTSYLVLRLYEVTTSTRRNIRVVLGGTPTALPYEYDYLSRRGTLYHKVHWYRYAGTGVLSAAQAVIRRILICIIFCARGLDPRPPLGRCSHLVTILTGRASRSDLVAASSRVRWLGDPAAAI